jgi:hypothetical protein
MKRRATLELHHVAKLSVFKTRNADWGRPVFISHRNWAPIKLDHFSGIATLLYQQFRKQIRDNGTAGDPLVGRLGVDEPREVYTLLAVKFNVLK